MAGDRRWGIPLIALGACQVVGGVVLAAMELRFRAGSVATQARIVEMREAISTIGRPNQASIGGIEQRYLSHAPVFAFTLPDGREVRALANVATPEPCCAVGDIVTVRYRPEAPERAQMEGFLESWIAALAVGGGGVFFLGLGWALRRFGSP
jgi:hypothetical protein